MGLLQRLLQFLRLCDGQSGFNSDRPLAAIAAEIGLTPEALYRTVARLEKEGRIEREGKSLRLIDHHKT